MYNMKILQIYVAFPTDLEQIVVSEDKEIRINTSISENFWKEYELRQNTTCHKSTIPMDKK